MAHLIPSTVVVVLCCLWSAMDAAPLLDPAYLKMGDTAVVGSEIREVRAAEGEATEVHDLLHAGTDNDPENFERYYDSGDQGTKGYLKRGEDKGSKGYKHFDSYNKKDGDKYGFEHHTSFGHGAKDAKDGLEHHSKYQKGNDDSGKGEQKEGTHGQYEVSENISEYEPQYDSGKSAAYSNEGDYGYADGGNVESEHYTSDGNSGAEGGKYTGEHGYYTGGSDGAHYEGDSGKSEHYTDGGEYSGDYHSSGNADGESEHYTEDGGDDDSGHYSEGDGESAHYSVEGGGDGESESYTSADDGDSDGQSEHYTAADYDY